MVRITSTVVAACLVACAYASPIVDRKLNEIARLDSELLKGTSFVANGGESSPKDLSGRAFSGNGKEPSPEDLNRRAFPGNGKEPSLEDLSRRAFASGGEEPSPEDLNRREESVGGTDEKNSGDGTIINESALGQALSKEIKRTEENLHTRISRLPSKEMDKQNQRFEDARIHEQEANFARHRTGRNSVAMQVIVEYLAYGGAIRYAIEDGSFESKI
ncbi:hypothetical protein EV368DRAFT_70529 [Lentinula lateritia]|nr:hypothetical protein EV368DRAFT_70529 [Lentinula lateritia]